MLTVRERQEDRKTGKRDKTEETGKRDRQKKETDWKRKTGTALREQ